MRQRTLTRRLTALGLALLFVMAGIGPALAGVWTDQADYPPGSTVYVNGDGMLAGETVDIVVTAPYGTETGSATANASGAFTWSFTLPADDSAEGNYSYTAKGRDSGTVQSGTFTDHGSSPVTDASYSITANASHLIALSVDLGGGSLTVSLTAATMKVANVTDSTTTDVTLTSPGGNGNGTWTGSFQGVCGKTYKINNVMVTWTTGHDHSSTEVPDSSEGTDQVTTGACPVSNNPPTADAGGPYIGDEGSPVQLNGTGSSDSDGTIVTYAWNAIPQSGGANDPDAGATCSFDDATSSTPQITCTDDGIYDVTLTVTDDDGATDIDTTTLTLADVAPSIGNLNLSAPSINENNSVILSGSFSDPGTNDTHQVVINWGTSQGSTTIPNASLTNCGDADPTTKCFSASHQYLDDNPTGTPSDIYSISVTVTDDDTGSDLANTSVTVNNIPPVIDTVTGPTDPLPVTSASVTVTANFTDVGTQDTHTCSISWDDDTTTYPTVTQGAGNGSCSDVHIYTAAGVYTVVVTITDDDTGAASASPALIVVYDPSAGFVTGGGWINSLAGAYTADPTLTGKANFGFVSKYKKGANVPDGQTEFQFKAGNLNFHSTSYQWLVVSGCKAQYKGTGTINGGGNYGFLLTAYDGALNGCGSDRFRIKIWDIATGTVVYDNGLGASDDIDVANPMELGGGSIVIHK